MPQLKQICLLIVASKDAEENRLILVEHGVCKRMISDKIDRLEIRYCSCKYKPIDDKELRPRANQKRTHYDARGGRSFCAGFIHFDKRLVDDVADFERRRRVCDAGEVGVAAERVRKANF